MPYRWTSDIRDEDALKTDGKTTEGEDASNTEGETTAGEDVSNTDGEDASNKVGQLKNNVCGM
jgi:hypothetical protein